MDLQVSTCYLDLGEGKEEKAEVCRRVSGASRVLRCISRRHLPAADRTGMFMILLREGVSHDRHGAVSGISKCVCTGSLTQIRNIKKVK